MLCCQSLQAAMCEGQQHGFEPSRGSLLAGLWLELPMPCWGQCWDGALLCDPNASCFGLCVQKNHSGGEFCIWRICLREQRLLSRGALGMCCKEFSLMPAVGKHLQCRV